MASRQPDLKQWRSNNVAGPRRKSSQVAASTVVVQTCVSSVCTYVNSTVCTVCRCKQSVTFTEQLEGYHTEVTEVNETKDFTPLSKGLRRTSQLDQPVQPCTAVHSKSIWLQQMVKVLSLEAAKWVISFWVPLWLQRGQV